MSGATSAFQLKARRIAVLRALHLGDLLLAVPALRSLRRRFPDAEVTLIGLPWAASFARRFSRYVDRFVEFPGYPGIGEVSYDAARTERFLTEQRAYGFDLVLQLHGSGQISNRFAIDLGGAVAAGYFVEERPPGLDVAAPYPATLHEIDRNLRLVGMVGGSVTDRSLEFPLTHDDRSEAGALLGPMRDRPLVVLHPGSKLPSRRWMPDRFAAVADALVERHDAGIVLTGTAGEVDVVDAVASAMSRPALCLAGKTSLGGLAAIIEQASLFISNDTGPAHLAAALRTPSIVLYGPGDLERWKPLDSERHQVIRVPVACSPCLYEFCPIDHRCLRAIDPDRVLSAASGRLRAARRRYEPERLCAG